MEIRNEIPEATPTDPDLSDADATLEYVPRSHSEPVIRTLEVTEADIVEVHAAVAALEAEEALATERMNALPPPVPPPKRVIAPSKKIPARQWLLLAAALGTWTFFVSLASLAAFGVHSFLRAHAEHTMTASVVAPIIAPSRAAKRTRFIAEAVPPRALPITSDDSRAADESRASDETQMSSEESTRRTSRFGILRFAHATNGALVDGEPRRVTGDALFLSCGAHRIRTSGSGSRTVRVPCGKTVTL